MTFRKPALALSLVLASFALSACQTTGGWFISDKDQCAENLTSLSNNVRAPADHGKQTTLAWVEAAQLVSSARVWQSQENYENCVQDTEKAKELLSKS